MFSFILACYGSMQSNISEIVMHLGRVGVNTFNISYVVFCLRLVDISTINISYFHISLVSVPCPVGLSVFFFVVVVVVLFVGTALCRNKTATEWFCPFFLYTFSII